MGKAKRVSRLLEIVSVLQSGTGWFASALAERFGVSRTRIFGDIRALRDAGVPVRNTPSGYTIDPKFFLPSVRLTPQELRSLLFPCDLFVGGEEERTVLDSARSKLLACLPKPLRREADELLRRTSVVVPTGDVSDEVFARLRTAIAERQRIEIDYQGRTSRRRRLEVDPYGLAFRKHAWYMIAHSLEHREIRKFRVSRIREATPTRLHFPPPTDFSLDAHFEGAWYIFGGEPREIGLRFSSRAARFVRERIPIRGQLIQTLDGGAILYRATVNNLDEVAWWLMQYGGDAKVLYPDELADKVVALAKGILNNHPAATRRAKAYRRPKPDRSDRVGEPGPDTPSQHT